MINRKELMVGNYVRVFGSTGIATVEVIGIRAIRHSKGESPYFEIEPAYLNEKWLKRFDFFRTDASVLKLESWEKNGLIIFKRNGFWNSNITSRIEYVHQVQNLFFAISGSELII